MILENIAHLLSKNHDKEVKETTFTTPIDADKIRVTRNKFAKLSRGRKIAY